MNNFDCVRKYIRDFVGLKFQEGQFYSYSIAALFQGNLKLLLWKESRDPRWI